MRALVTAIASVAMALGAFGLAVAAPHAGRGDEPRAALASSSGALRISNSRAGQSVFSAAAMRPGAGVSGAVRIGNAGELPGRFSLHPSSLQDVPGPYGGRLSERVQLVLSDVTDAENPVALYAGTPAGLGTTDLGTFAPGAQRDYLVSAMLPDGGLPGSVTAGDNRYQGSALSLDLEWRAVAAGGAPVPDPPTTPVPGGAPLPPPPPAPGGAVEPAGGALADALGLAPTRACVKRRRMTVRLRTPDRSRVVAARIAINGKVRARVRGAKAARPIKLRRLPRGRITLRAAVRAANGRNYTVTRSYRACKGKRKLRRR